MSATTERAATMEKIVALWGEGILNETYGCTEVGPVAWECAAHDGYHLAAETTLVECLPQAAGDPSPVVLTSLELRAMPLIRYAVGDLASPKAGPPCPCGCRLPRLARIEGRIADCVRLRDGRMRSPYHLTLALEQVEGLVRYQVVQEELDRFLVRAQGRAEPQTGQRVGIANRRHLVHGTDRDAGGDDVDGNQQQRCDSLMRSSQVHRHDHEQGADSKCNLQDSQRDADYSPAF